MSITEWLRGWWSRNVIMDAPPFTDDEAERWKARERDRAASWEPPTTPWDVP